MSSSSASASASVGSSNPNSNSAYQSYDDTFKRAAERMVENVNTYLPLAFYYNDEDRISFYLRRLNDAREMKQPNIVTKTVKQEWIRLLITKLLEKGEQLQIHVQIKMMQLAIALYAHEKEYDLAFDWKPFYAYMSRYHLNDSTRAISNFTTDSMAHHQNLLVQLVTKTRRYFIGSPPQSDDFGGFTSPIPVTGGSVGEEVLTTFIPFLSPFDNKYFASQALICLFFPSHIRQSNSPSAPSNATPGANYASYAKLLKLYPPFTSNLIDICPLTIQLNMQLYSRLAKHALGYETGDGVEIMEPFFAKNNETFFATFLQILELDIAGKHSHNSHRQWTAYAELIHPRSSTPALSRIAQYFSKYIIYTLHRGQDETDEIRKKSTPLGKLVSLLYILRTYVHPSQANSGREWQNAISNFLVGIASYFARRVGREIRGEVKYDKKYFIDTNNYDLVLALQPILFQGLYSKSSHMISNCETSLRTLATFYPHLILPGMMSSVEQSLVDVNTSHRMMSNLQAMSGLANIAFNAELNPGTCGQATSLINLLNLSLPGIDIIDPLKTSFTMAWLAILFYVVPFIDARDSTAGENEDDDVQLPDVNKLAAPQRYSLEITAPTREQYGESIEQARTSTMQFEDWSLAYVDTLVRLLGSVDKFAKSDYADRAFAWLLYKNTRAFFSCLSPRIFQSVSTKLIHLILSEHHPTAQKHWGCIVHTMSLGQTEMFLQAFLPAVFKKVLVKEKFSSSLADSELEWYLHLIGQAVKQGGGPSPSALSAKAQLNGELLLQYIAPIQQLYNLALAHDSKSIRKVGRKMLRNLLKGLTFTYPAEWSNHSKAQHPSTLKSGVDKNWKHWTLWGTYAPNSEPQHGMPDIDLLWHVPTERELTAAENIVADALQQPLTWLRDWVDGKETSANGSEDVSSASATQTLGKNDTPLERHLQSIVSLLRGIQPVMGKIEGSPFNTQVDDEDNHDLAYNRAGSNHDTRCPLIEMQYEQPVRALGGRVTQEILTILTSPQANLKEITSLRTYLVRFSHILYNHIRQLSVGPISLQPSTKSTILVIKLILQILTGYGVHESRLHQSRTGGHISRQRLRDQLSGIRSRIRPHLAQKLYDFHLIRMNMLSYNEVYTEDVALLIRDLHHAAINDFTKVRSRGTSLLIAALRRYPQAIDDTITRMLEIFSNRDRKLSDENLLGCMGVLADRSMTTWITRKWFRMSQFLTTFFRYGEYISSDDKVQLLIQQLFNKMFPSFHMRKVELPLVDGSIPVNLTHLIDTAKVSRRNQSIQRYNKRLSKTYLELMTFLHNNSVGQVQPSANGSSSATDSKTIHWRYSLMSAAFFFSLSRAVHYEVATKNVDSTDGFISYHQYVTFFLRGANSTLAPLRLISFLALSKLLATHSLFIRQELNTLAEEVLGQDPIKILASLDLGETTPKDPASSLSKHGSILTFTQIETDKEMLSTVFHDYLYSGWMGDIYNTVVCKYVENTLGRYSQYHGYTYFTPLSVNAPLRYPYKTLPTTSHAPVTPLADATLSTIFEYYTANSCKNLHQLFHHFVYDHASLAPSHEGSSGNDRDHGAGAQIAALAKQGITRNKVFPTTRFNAKSDAFDMVHVNVVRGLIEIFPELITKEEYGTPIMKMITDLIQSKDEPDKQCSAAEILCGITVSIKHFTQATRQRFQTILLPVWLEALRSVQPDCLDHYGDALRHLYTNMDPRRLSWLSGPLFLDALAELPSDDFIAENIANTQINPKILQFTPAEASPSPSPSPSPQPSAPPSPSAVTAERNVTTNMNESPSVQFKRLRFLLPCLIEVGYRGTKLGEWIITTFKKKGFLYHPFQQVREEISWILFILTRNEFALCKNHPAQSPGGSVVEPAATLSVISSPVHLRFLHYIREQFDSVKELYRIDKNMLNLSSSPTAVANLNGSLDQLTIQDDQQQQRHLMTKHMTAQKERAKHFTETVLTWLHATLVCGDMVFISSFYQAFLPYVLWAQLHPDPDIGTLAKFTSTGAAWMNAGGQALEPVSSVPTQRLEPAEGVTNMHDAELIPSSQTLSLTEPHSRRAPLDSPSQVIDNILSNLRATTLAPENSWHVRVAVAKFMQIWLPRHSLSFNPQQLQEIEDLIIDSLLQDPQIEVREAASHAFTSFVASSFPLTVPTKQTLLDRHEELVEMGEEEPTGAIVLQPHPHILVMMKKLKKLVTNGKKGSSSSSSSKSNDTLTLAQRHGGLLGLTGLVLTHPYDLPAHIPDLLSFLGQYVEDRNQNISSSLRKFFASFTSSHKDEWDVFSRQFTPEQIEELQSMQLAPSYFA